MAFRRHKSQVSEFALDGLHDIESGEHYQVTKYHSYGPEAAQKVTGEELLRSKAEINDCAGSVLIEYKKVDK